MFEIKILGTGCAKCVKLADYAKEAVVELGLQASLEKVTDPEEIMAYGVMQTPGLVINGMVKVSGRVPKVEEIKEFLQNVE